MKYFMDTHDRARGSWPSEAVSETEFVQIYEQFGKAVAEQGGHDLGAVATLLLFVIPSAARDPFPVSSEAFKGIPRAMPSG